MAAHAPRYAPERPFPPYAFTPGRAPHPRSDPEGHSFGRPEPEPERLDLARWRDSEEYLFGIDLFNHGYYWEAHESWESLWLAAGRHGPTAEFLKGLIKLTASALKVRLEQPEGAQRHARNAIAHLESAAAATGSRWLAGLDIDCAQAIARRLEALAAAEPPRSLRVIDDVLILGDTPAGERLES